MTEQLVSIETAKIAKEKGLDVKVTTHYRGTTLNTRNFTDNFNRDFVDAKDLYTVPTQSLLQKWLREVHNIHVEPSIHSNLKYFFLGCRIREGVMDDFQTDYGYFDTYEEALEAGLLEGLKQIK